MHKHLEPQQAGARTATRRPVAVRRTADEQQQLGHAAVSRVLGASMVQRAGATSGQLLDESIARAIEERRGRGRQLDDRVRADMETSLGHDLSEVRVHTDSTANELSKAVSARAFTTGNDVFFKQGTYNPESNSGRELLGHELTHVVQQRAGTSGLGPGEVSHPSDASEQRAAEAGKALADGPASLTAAGAQASPGIARQERGSDHLENGMDGAGEVSAQRDEADEDVDDQDRVNA